MYLHANQKSDDDDDDEKGARKSYCNKYTNNNQIRQLCRPHGKL